MTFAEDDYETPPWEARIPLIGDLPSDAAVVKAAETAEEVESKDETTVAKQPESGE